jgi:hypothetical protein
MQPFDFKTENYFKGKSFLFGVILVFISFLLLLTNLLAGLIGFIISVVIFTTHYRLKIDTQNKTVYDYVWILGMKNGQTEKFNNIEYIFINKNLSTQTLYTRVQSHAVTDEVYDAYLKFSENHKIHLLKSHSKAQLINSIGKIAKQLNIKVIDYAEGEAQEVTLN